VLVDTSVWVDYFHGGNRQLARALDAGAVWMHPLIIGELACGRFSDRRTVFALLATLRSLDAVAHDEALAFLDHNDLAGRGLGWIDVHLLASARLTGLTIWTRDRELAAAGRRVGLKVRYGQTKNT
jgi:predicted nucleic acid-binding protein